MRRLVMPLLVVSCAMVGGIPPVFAAGASKDATIGAMYRYRNDKGVVMIESSIPPEYVSKGYQVLSRTGQVLQDVPPAQVLLSDDERKARSQAEADNGRRDAQLRVLYSSPQDAERQRDRQLDALKLKVEQIQGQIHQALSRRQTDVDQAAAMERKGITVPPAIKDNITQTAKRISDLNGQVVDLQKEQQRLRDEFSPVIERLKVIYPSKGTVAPVSTTPVVPAPAAPAAKTPGR